jgi:hypothetical protein
MNVLNSNWFDLFGIDEDSIRSLYEASKKITFIPELLHGEGPPPPPIKPIGFPLGGPDGIGTKYLSITKEKTTSGTTLIIILLIILAILIGYLIYLYLKDKKEEKERVDKEWEALRNEVSATE